MRKLSCKEVFSPEEDGCRKVQGHTGDGKQLSACQFLQAHGYFSHCLLSCNTQSAINEAPRVLDSGAFSPTNVLCGRSCCVMLFKNNMLLKFRARNMHCAIHAGAKCSFVANRLTCLSYRLTAILRRHHASQARSLGLLAQHVAVHTLLVHHAIWRHCHCHAIHLQGRTASCTYADHEHFIVPLVSVSLSRLTIGRKTNELSSHSTKAEQNHDQGM